MYADSATGGGAGVQGPGVVGAEEGAQCARDQDQTVAGVPTSQTSHS